MAQKSGARRVSGALADATGRSEDELQVALTVAVVAAGVLAALRLVTFLGDLGSHVFVRSKKSG